jgi:23S rRNA (cytosine1962-C5)-methyltransferase
MSEWSARTRWVDSDSIAAHCRERTTAYRLATTVGAWIERFAEDCLISAPDEGQADRLQRELHRFSLAQGLPIRRTFRRLLVKQPGESDVPVLVDGPKDLEPVVPIQEFGIHALADFSAGYSVGWFCDQRENRRWLESEIRPKRLLNCFSYTGAFSLSAARSGAATTSIDLSKRTLQRARENFQRNGWQDGPHRFLADDVFKVLPRLARRGERFDAIILDPPTFSRGASGRVFRAEDQLGELLALARDVCEPGAWILLSTNARQVDVATLKRLTRDQLPTAELKAVPPPKEYPPGSASSTLWIHLK